MNLDTWAFREALRRWRFDHPDRTLAAPTYWDLESLEKSSVLRAAQLIKLEEHKIHQLNSAVRVIGKGNEKI